MFAGEPIDTSAEETQPNWPTNATGPIHFDGISREDSGYSSLWSLAFGLQKGVQGEVVLLSAQGKHEKGQ